MFHRPAPSGTDAACGQSATGLYACGSSVPQRNEHCKTVLFKWSVIVADTVD
jgi:hypothetical protein